MLQNNYNDKSFENFLNLFKNKQTCKRRHLAIPWRNGLTHHHYYCEFSLLSCHFDTFIPKYVKILNEVLDEFEK